MAKPSTRSTSTRPYQERSSTAIPPQPGRAELNRSRKWWRFSSAVGAAYEATRTWRGSSGVTSRRIAPPLPEASQPSNSASTGGPSGWSSREPGTGRPPHSRRSANSRCWAASSRLASSCGEKLERQVEIVEPTHESSLSSEPLPPHRSVDPSPSFPRLEEAVLERWRERDVFRESLRRREGADRFVFYEGPPTVNGPPGAHHVLARVFKDIFPRYKTMRGYYVERKGG